MKSFRQIVATPRKWPRSVLALEDRAELEHVDPGLVAGRIHLRDGRREDDVDAGVRRELEVAAASFRG